MDKCKECGSEKIWGWLSHSPTCSKYKPKSIGPCTWSAMTTKEKCDYVFGPSFKTNNRADAFAEQIPYVINMNEKTLPQPSHTPSGDKPLHQVVQEQQEEIARLKKIIDKLLEK